MNGRLDFDVFGPPFRDGGEVERELPGGVPFTGPGQDAADGRFQRLRAAVEIEPVEGPDDLDDQVVILRQLSDTESPIEMRDVVGPRPPVTRVDDPRIAQELEALVVDR